MRPGPGEVLHFSEDPTITRFAPHVAATARTPDSYVWAVDGPRAPAYWFPRQCPRVLAWPTPRSTPEDVERVLGPGGGARVHAIGCEWLEAMRTTELFAYRLPAATFTPIGEPEPHAHVSTQAVEPLGRPEPVGDLLTLHAEARIQLRLVPDLRRFWQAAHTSTLGFSGIRLRNAGID